MSQTPGIDLNDLSFAVAVGTKLPRAAPPRIAWPVGEAVRGTIATIEQGREKAQRGLPRSLIHMLAGSSLTASRPIRPEADALLCALAAAFSDPQKLAPNRFCANAKNHAGGAGRSKTNRFVAMWLLFLATVRRRRQPLTFSLFPATEATVDAQQFES